MMTLNSPAQRIGQSLAERAKNYKGGGPVKGPGTGTSDSIDAKLSNGEFVLPADSAQAVGPANLQALLAATHKPVPSAPPTRMPLARAAMANGGTAWDQLYGGSKTDGSTRGQTYAPGGALATGSPPPTAAAPGADGVVQAPKTDGTEWGAAYAPGGALAPRMANGGLASRALRMANGGDDYYDPDMGALRPRPQAGVDTPLATAGRGIAAGLGAVGSVLASPLTAAAPNVGTGYVEPQAQAVAQPAPQPAPQSAPQAPRPLASLAQPSGYGNEGRGNGAQEVPAPTLPDNAGMTTDGMRVSGLATAKDNNVTAEQMNAPFHNEYVAMQARDRMNQAQAQQGMQWRDAQNQANTASIQAGLENDRARLNYHGRGQYVTPEPLAARVAGRQIPQADPVAQAAAVQVAGESAQRNDLANQGARMSLAQSAQMNPLAVTAEQQKVGLGQVTLQHQKAQQALFDAVTNAKSPAEQMQALRTYHSMISGKGSYVPIHGEGETYFDPNNPTVALRRPAEIGSVDTITGDYRPAALAAKGQQGSGPPPAGPKGTVVTDRQGNKMVSDGTKWVPQ